MNEARPLKAHIWGRSDDEWYVEPVFVSDALFAVEKFDGGIWDPACGQGNILLAAIAAGHKDILGSDTVQRGRISKRLWTIKDFLNCRRLLFPNIVTNPPFGRAILAEKFIRHAISLKPQKLAVFVDSRFLFGMARSAGLFSEFPPARVWLITPRPSCPPGVYLEAGNKAGGGTADYCWLIWESERVLSSTWMKWLKCAP